MSKFFLKVIFALSKTLFSGIFPTFKLKYMKKKEKKNVQVVTLDIKPTRNTINVNFSIR
jgi:hypothetical protein